MQNRRLITFTCDNCGHEAQKPLSEYKRNLRLARKNFCCRSCAFKYGKQIHKYDTYTDKQIKSQQNIKKYCHNKRDEWTPFRYSLRNAKKRFKDVNITLQDLKQVWEDQKGICPYTGLKLELPTYNNHIHVWKRASLDRIDSSKGYIVGNIQFVSTPMNLMKSTMSDLETKQYLKLISSWTLSFDKDGTISSPIKEPDADSGN